MGKVLVFGTFDRLNAGHIAFLEQAKQFGEALVVLVVEDEFVSRYKGRPPQWSLTRRMKAVQQLPLKAEVYEEDIRAGWRSLRKIQPAVIVLSAEQARWQQRLEVVLQEYNLRPRIEILPGAKRTRASSESPAATK